MGVPGIFFSMQSINIRFTDMPPRQLQIKNIMKTLTTIQDKKNIPSLFQAAAQIENESPVPAAMKPVTSLNETPLADLMLNPKQGGNGVVGRQDRRSRNQPGFHQTHTAN